MSRGWAAECCGRRHAREPWHPIPSMAKMPIPRWCSKAVADFNKDLLDLHRCKAQDICSCSRRDPRIGTGSNSVTRRGKDWSCGEISGCIMRSLAGGRVEDAFAEPERFGCCFDIFVDVDVL